MVKLEDSFLNYLLKTAIILYHKYGLERSSKTLLDSYDFIVVGGGSAGAIVAAKLSVNPSINVLLLESGGSGSHITDIPHISTELNTKSSLSRSLYSTVQRSGVCNGKKCLITVGHILGGGSTHNNMKYVRGSRQDYSDWTRYGVKGWSYEDVLPYMVELETYEDVSHGLTRGTKGPVHVTRQENYPFEQIRKLWTTAALKAGYEVGDYNGPRQTYFADSQKNIRNGVRQSTDNVYLKPVMGKRSNLHVIMFSHVTRILFNGNTAIGVEYSRNGTLYNVMASREVILSAGTLASPQILMLSGIGPAHHLKKFNLKVIANLPGVGRNFQDQFGVNTFTSTNQSYPKNSHVTKANYNLWMKSKTGILAAARGCSTGYATSQYSRNSNDTQITFSYKVLRDEVHLGRIMLETNVVSARSYSRGYVKLRSTDPFDQLIVNPRYLSRVEDRNNVIQGLKILFAMFKSDTYKSINVKLIIDGKTSRCSQLFKLYTDAWLYCYSQTNGGVFYHFTSTCRMGALSDPMAVVDERLKVRYVQRLRVIDASVMPQVVRGNTNAPTMAIGLKGAAMILQDWRL